jgi:hypothetical protein
MSTPLQNSNGIAGTQTRKTYPQRLHFDCVHHTSHKTTSVQLRLSHFTYTDWPIGRRRYCLAVSDMSHLPGWFCRVFPYWTSSVFAPLFLDRCDGGTDFSA